MLRSVSFMSDALHNGITRNKDVFIQTAVLMNACNDSQGGFYG